MFIKAKTTYSFHFYKYNIPIIVNHHETMCIMIVKFYQSIVSYTLISIKSLSIIIDKQITLKMA